MGNHLGCMTPIPVGFFNLTPHGIPLSQIPLSPLKSVSQSGEVGDLLGEPPAHVNRARQLGTLGHDAMRNADAVVILSKGRRLLVFPLVYRLVLLEVLQ